MSANVFAPLRHLGMVILSSPVRGACTQATNEAVPAADTTTPEVRLSADRFALTDEDGARRHLLARVR